MFKRMAFVACAGMLFFGIDVGNKICPVAGEKIDEKTKTTYEYEGRIYNFCCPACIDEFKKEPEKYIKKIDEENKAKDMQNGKSIATAESTHRH